MRHEYERKPFVLSQSHRRLLSPAPLVSVVSPPAQLSAGAGGRIPSVQPDSGRYSSDVHGIYPYVGCFTGEEGLLELKQTRVILKTKSYLVPELST